jgi:hypothetical protein
MDSSLGSVHQNANFHQTFSYLPHTFFSIFASRFFDSIQMIQVPGGRSPIVKAFAAIASIVRLLSSNRNLVNMLTLGIAPQPEPGLRRTSESGERREFEFD